MDHTLPDASYVGSILASIEHNPFGAVIIVVIVFLIVTRWTGGKKRD